MSYMDNDDDTFQMILGGYEPATAYGFTFYLNNPLKRNVFHILRRLELGDIYINGVDDITQDKFPKGEFKTLREVIQYAQHLERKVNQ